MSTTTLSARSPLHRSAFRRLWVGLSLSRMGDAFTAVALIWFVLQLTGSGVAIGLVVLSFQLPAMITSPLIGKLLDRYQPRVLMGVDNFGRAVIIAAIPVLYWVGGLQLWMVYVLALCAGILSPATEIGVRVVVPMIVDDKELERANALSSISWDVATLVGPACAGLLVLIISAPSVLLIDAATFVVMGTAALTLPGIKREHVGEKRAKNQWLGFGTILSIRSVRLLTILTLLFLFAQGMTELTIPVYSLRTLGAGVAGYGLLMSAFGVGSLLALLFISQFWVRSNRQGVTLAGILLLSGLLLLPLIVIHMLPVAMIVIALAGCAAAPYYVVEQSLMQRLVPEQLRGQVFGARGALNIAGYPLGGAVAGLLLGVMVAPLVIGVAGLMFIVMGGTCLVSPTIRGMRKLD